MPAGRLRLLPAAEHDSRTACGIFAVPKSTQADRMIVDARPINLVMASENDWLTTMGAASSLLRIELDEHEQLYCSGEDVK